MALEVVLMMLVSKIVVFVLEVKFIPVVLLVIVESNVVFILPINL